jgi:nocardicin nonribosomal peptide synthetase NocB
MPNPFATTPGARMYRTGDRAIWRPDGVLEFRGRRDLQVKVRGHRVELEAIEAILRRRPGGGAAVVQARTTASGETVLEATVEGREAGEWGARAVRAWLSTQLPAAVVPTTVRVVPALPLTVTGKIDRRRVAGPAPIMRPAESPVWPRTPMEKLVAEAWAAELGRDTVTAHEDVFDLGATSLSVMRVFSRLKRLLPAPGALEVAHLFKAPTAAGLAELVLAPVSGSGADSVAAICLGRAGPPLFLVHPVQGVASAYFSLRGLLDDLEIHAFNDPRLGAAEQAFGTLEEMATVYVEWVRSLAGSRRPVVGGWSFGGVVALEMARQMRRRGSDLGGVLMIDSYNLAGRARPAGRDTDRAPAKTPDVGSQIIADEVARNEALVRARIESRYEGQVVLLRASDVDADLRAELGDRNGWDASTLPALEVVPVEGSHDDLFAPDHAPSTARAIRDAILTTDG